MARAGPLVLLRHPPMLLADQVRRRRIRRPQRGPVPLPLGRCTSGPLLQIPKARAGSLLLSLVARNEHAHLGHWRQLWVAWREWRVTGHTRLMVEVDMLEVHRCRQKILRSLVQLVFVKEKEVASIHRMPSSSDDFTFARITSDANGRKTTILNLTVH